MAQLSMFMVSKIFPSRKRKIVVDGIVPRGWGGPGWRGTEFRAQWVDG